MINAYNYHYSHTHQTNHTKHSKQCITCKAKCQSLTINTNPSTITLVNKTQTCIKQLQKQHKKGMISNPKY